MSKRLRRRTKSNRDTKLVLDVNDPTHIVDPRFMKRVESWRSLHGRPAPLEDILANLQKFSLRTLLLHVSYVNRKLEGAHVRMEAYVSREVLALLARLAVLVSTVDGGIDPTQDQVTELFLKLNDHLSSRIRPDQDLAPQLERISVQLMHANDLDKAYYHDIPRTWLLYDDIARKASPEFDIPGKFAESMHGMSVREYVGIVTALAGRLTQHPCVMEEYFRGSGGRLNELGRAVIQECAATPERIREEFRMGSDPLSCNPLLRYPLIELQGDAGREFHCPVNCML